MESLENGVQQPSQLVTEEEKVQTKKESLIKVGEKMKEYEKKFNQFVDPSKPMLIRLDGHKFSTFTRGFQRPFDQNLHYCMIQTLTSLMKEFNVDFGYTQSDEITLVFMPKYDKFGKLQSYMFSNKTQKFISLTAAKATNTFTNAIRNLIDQGKITTELYGEKKMSKLRSPSCFFDSRVFNVDEELEVIMNVKWRSSFDCVRNSVSRAAQANFPHKQLQSLKSRQLKAKLLEEKKIDWNDMDPYFKYGAFAKRKMVDQEVSKEHQEFEGQQVKRSKFMVFSFNMVQFDDEILTECLLKRGTWSDEEEKLLNIQHFELI